MIYKEIPRDIVHNGVPEDQNTIVVGESLLLLPPMGCSVRWIPGKCLHMPIESRRIRDSCCGPTTKKTKSNDGCWQMVTHNPARFGSYALVDSVAPRPCHCALPFLLVIDGRFFKLCPAANEVPKIHPNAESASLSIA
jgi:hypothetical protein